MLSLSGITYDQSPTTVPLVIKAPATFRESPTDLGVRMRRTIALALLLPLAAHAQGPKLNKYGNPPKVAPAPTTAAITVRDLQIRLYQFSDDSMQGRQVGRIGNMKGTNYIAARSEAARPRSRRRQRHATSRCCRITFTRSRITRASP